VLPTGSAQKALGAGGFGWQVSLPFSVRLGSYFVTHLNAGATWLPSGKGSDGSKTSWFSYSVGQSLIALVHPRFNLLVEVLWTAVDATAGRRTAPAEALVVSPGVRFGLDLPGDLQVVPGIAFPIGVGPSAGSLGVFGYLSFEFPFSRAAAEHGKD
jgi:hypothetical protein